MVDTPLPPATDARALRHVQGRLARAPEAPWLHQEVARRMAERLAILRQPAAQWLDWSGFVGAGQVPVMAQWPQARCSVVEDHPALAERSRQALRGPWWTGRRARAAVLTPDEVPAAQAQMLWANLQWHAAPRPDDLLSRWHRALAVEGVLMFSCFGPDTLAELRAVYAAQGWPAPHPPFVDMHDIGDALVRAGFADPVMDQEQLRLTWSGPQALLDELRGLGGHLGLGRFAGLRTPRWRQQLMAALAQRADDQRRIGMRFEIIYGHAIKPAPRMPRPSPDAAQVVRLDALRSRLVPASSTDGTPAAGQDQQGGGGTK